MVAIEQDPAHHAASEGFRLGKLFHLTPLVDSIADAELFFNSVFSPLCMMRGYSDHWHRHGAIYLIAETSIEPMEPLPPPPGAEGTSWFRYMDKYGPHVHNIAFYVHNAPALAARLAEAGVRTTDGGAPGAVFAHPKDTPAMLEFFDPGDPAKANLNDPRFSPYWIPLRDDFWPGRHPLGLERLSHITVVVQDIAAARAFYVDVLDSVPLPDQESSVADADAAFVLVGEDTVLELVHPRDPSSVVARELETVGQCVTGVTFKVRDIERASAHLTLHSAPVLSVGEHVVLLDRERTWNTDYRFTDVDLVGDPRTIPLEPVPLDNDM
jgi:catechol 2,3-dioxygenase-like lactoylglutathione lyase family enzyme